ncbi:MAG: hypothetical protein K8F92_06560 [Hyphomicrobium sp.]|uniref:hypothetical protein n=1 Tax=Hyphomicrobium sp. TaxID=82 RepID=UPI001328548E|nr:hypothetical protein [Hyphomicrobium sp.]KAB2944004.1 MAG: hypothetical protein F9K20_00845 [Hyphomicrobium sp.]MBZ0209296.1 hypothetical protein [Hyphomicrobium sp.]MCZ7593834.1 hypothetical protein [Hyphomicrobium sp.]
MAEGIVMVHVRFSPDGSVTEIGERPSGASPQQWFNRLSDAGDTHYQALSGGRGVFRMTRGIIDALKEGAANGAAGR